MKLIRDRRFKTNNCMAIAGYGCVSFSLHYKFVRGADI